MRVLMKARGCPTRESSRIVPTPRAVAIERDRWVGDPAGNAGFTRPAQLHATRARARLPCLLIYGDSGAGKSMLLAKFQRDHAPKRQSGGSSIDHIGKESEELRRFGGGIYLIIANPKNAKGH